jgi:ribonuclease HI
MGAVLRDYQGKFVAANMKFLPHVLSMKMAEALAMKQGLLLAHQLGCNRVIAESDSSMTIEACSGEQRWDNESTTVYADCIDLVASIGSVSFTHCLREANSVSHCLAREGFTIKESCNWDDEPPGFILDTLLNDVTIL